MMRPLVWIGIVVLVLGILAFVVPVPTSHTHGIKMGDTSLGVTTHSDEKLSPIVGGVLCAAGVVLLVAGSRKTTA
jgi:drug/metabolite transporter (DMT)-like permease